MDNQTKRVLLFLLGCIVVRSGLAYAAYKVDGKYLPYMGAAALLPVLGWLYIMFVSPRDTGAEVFGGRIWWQSLRPVHATLYALFAVSAFQQKPYSYQFLVADVALGLTAFLVHQS